jgi:SAM-dependent methyltransferase
MGRPVDERLSWAVRTLAIRATDRLLEIGCGRGTAAALVCERLATGQLTAIDRSAAMIRLAEQHNAAQIASGRAAFHAVALDEAKLDGPGFDTVFAISVNLFWVDSSTRELEIVRRALKPDGTMHLFYRRPDAARNLAMAHKVVAFLGERGFSAAVGTGPRSAVCVTARPTPL